MSLITNANEEKVNRKENLFQDKGNMIFEVHGTKVPP